MNKQLSNPFLNPLNALKSLIFLKPFFSFIIFFLEKIKEKDI